MRIDFLLQGYPSHMWGGDGSAWGHMMYGPGGMYFPFGGLLMVLVIFGLGVGLYLLIKRSGGSGKEDTAVEILKVRLAKGEITKEEFEGLLKVLK